MGLLFGHYRRRKALCEALRLKWGTGSSCGGPLQSHQPPGPVPLSPCPIPPPPPPPKRFPLALAAGLLAVSQSRGPGLVGVGSVPETAYSHGVTSMPFTTLCACTTSVGALSPERTASFGRVEGPIQAGSRGCPQRKEGFRAKQDDPATPEVFQGEASPLPFRMPGLKPIRQGKLKHRRGAVRKRGTDRANLSVAWEFLQSLIISECIYQKHRFPVNILTKYGTLDADVGMRSDCISDRLSAQINTSDLERCAGTASVPKRLCLRRHCWGVGVGGWGFLRG